MFGIGTGELILILAIAMLVVGPERMVDYARRGGRLLAKLRAQTDEVTKDFREAFKAETDGDPDNPLTTIAQLKDEAEGAVRDIQGTFSGVATTPRPPKAPSKAPAEQADAAAAVADDAQAAPTPPPADAAADVAADAATGGDDGASALAAVELVADDEGLELSGPLLVDDVAEVETTDEVQQ